MGRLVNSIGAAQGPTSVYCASPRDTLNQIELGYSDTLSHGRSPLSSWRAIAQKRDLIISRRTAD
jgi:hypothetical protein